MGQGRLFPPGFWGCLMGAGALMLAVFLTAATVTIQRPAPVFCQGLLGAGFPVPVVCDASGESPLSGVGRIGWEDAGHIRIDGIVADLACYAAPLWGIRMASTYLISRRMRPKNRG